MEIARAERGWAGDSASRANRTGTADVSYSAIQVCPVEGEEEFAQAHNVERGPVLLAAPGIAGRQGASLADGSHADARSEGCGLPSLFIAYPPGHGSGIIRNSCSMAWRPYENLVDGELDNRTAGRVTGWVRFFRRGMDPLKVDFYLEGDFHEDIRGSVVRLKNPRPADRNEALDRDGTYMEGFCPEQRGSVGDITAGFPLGFWTEDLARNLKERLEALWQERGLKGEELEEARRNADELFAENVRKAKAQHAYVSYPYIEWYSDNGRVVLELDPAQVEVLWGDEPGPRTAKELADASQKRARAFADYMTGMAEDLSRVSRQEQEDADSTGMHEAQ